jgi:murein DD-endopeptidase MepM/ murein hydrolase activator NlpD
VGQIPAAAVLGPVGSYDLQWPIHGVVTQEFGHNGHPGIDIAAAYGTPIVASGTGVVIYASWETGYGNYTCINHGGGISTCYGHQSFIAVSVGQTVMRGQYIGNEGSTGYSTGPHVHFEVRVNGIVHNPRDFIPGNP